MYYNPVSFDDNHPRIKLGGGGARDQTQYVNKQYLRTKSPNGNAHVMKYK